jgi:hypothetical protein
LHLGKDEVTWVHAQGVYLPTLGNMGMLDILDDPIHIPIETLIDRHKRTHKERCVHQRMGHTSSRDTTNDGHTSLFGCTGSTSGRGDLFGCDGL